MALFVTAAPSSAATAPTFNKQTGQLPGCVKYDVDTGGLKADALVCYNPNPVPGYDVTLTDDACDGFGLTFHTWNSKAKEVTQSTAGCKGNGNKAVAKDYANTSLGAPHNWWLEWDGVNSAAFAFPAPGS